MSTRIVWALSGAVACALVAMLTWALAFRTGFGHAADIRVLEGFRTLHETRAEPLAQLVAALCNPGPFAVLAGAVTVAALIVRGLAGAAVVAALLVIPNVVAQLLKRELAEPRVAPVGIDAAAWPSGHVTAAAALSLAVLLIVPGEWRRLAAVAGALFVAAMAGSVALLGWHFPSDAVGGAAIAGAGACLGAAALSPRAATAALASRWHRATG